MVILLDFQFVLLRFVTIFMLSAYRNSGAARPGTREEPVDSGQRYGTSISTKTTLPDAHDIV